MSTAGRALVRTPTLASRAACPTFTDEEETNDSSSPFSSASERARQGEVPRTRTRGQIKQSGPPATHRSVSDRTNFDGSEQERGKGTAAIGPTGASVTRETSGPTTTTTASRGAPLGVTLALTFERGRSRAHAAVAAILTDSTGSRSLPSEAATQKERRPYSSDDVTSLGPSSASTGVARSGRRCAPNRSISRRPAQWADRHRCKQGCHFLRRIILAAAISGKRSRKKPARKNQQDVIHTQPLQNFRTPSLKSPRFLSQLSKNQTGRVISYCYSFAFVDYPVASRPFLVIKSHTFLKTQLTQWNVLVRPAGV